LVIVGIAVLLCLPQVVLLLHYKPRMISKIDEISSIQYAVVFGTTVNIDGTLADITKERIEAAVLLYKQGKVSRLFISADNRHNAETQHIADYAKSLGVAPSDILTDDDGIDTYQTCKHLSEIAKTAVLVTQQFHLPRALYLCEQLGVQGTGLVVDNLGLLSSRGDNPLVILSTKALRFLKESASTWLHVLGVHS
jgi:vancomycin permeability regulator SanA